MYTHLQYEISELRDMVLKMSSMVKLALDKSINSFFNMDAKIAKEIIVGDDEINRLEVAIDKMCLKLLALESPVAKDLRFILGCMRASIDLERIGDETANVAQAVIVLSLKPVLPFYSKLCEIGYKAQIMLENAINSFFLPDPDLAIKVCKMDPSVNQLYSKIIKQIIEYMYKENPAIERSVYCINIARRFERISDLATNIAESAVFIAKGINIKHYKQFDNRS